MNVPAELTIAIKTLRVSIITDHLVASAILASLGMEPFVKVCSSFTCHYKLMRRYSFVLRRFLILP